MGLGAFVAGMLFVRLTISSSDHGRYSTVSRHIPGAVPHDRGYGDRFRSAGSARAGGIESGQRTAPGQGGVAVGFMPFRGPRSRRIDTRRTVASPRRRVRLRTVEPGIQYWRDGFGAVSNARFRSGHAHGSHATVI